MSDAVTQEEPAGDVALGSVEVVVGIPSYCNAKTIAHVATTAVRGLATHFPGRRSLVFNADGGSADGTPEVLRAHSFRRSERRIGVSIGARRASVEGNRNGGA